MSGSSQTLRQRFETSPFFSHLGFEILDAGKDVILLKLPIKKYLLNTNQTVHGGVYATMLDNIMSLAVRQAVEKDIVTVNMNINFLAPVKEGDIVASAKILHQGYRIVTCESEMYSHEDVLLAKGTGTFKVKKST
ncbi:PaaI family thioesterase [Bacillus sp. FJAT-44742]|uniref:PaaI family thioesterase n=1 Tax=Bacillus sp. FJAT-44742 TaxID=2014005 RepID=UPI000C23463B|nr:PaaI family thioesterase [Bacillus sp. FJAT-44742]